MTMKDKNSCPHCGAKIPADAPGGLCPQCLFTTGAEDDITSKPESEPIIEGPGTKIGRYKLLELLGEGGMGLVYLAEQQEPVRRKVALKIVKLGMDTMQVVARFEAERQTLALLEHPNIARVFDAGTTETGRPYFVMEYVEGVSITKYCDDQKLTVEQRLQLFRQTCEAVHHAHQKGIIHRDIKPSNILVSIQDGKPVPKIIDFGIAKAITQPLTDKTSYTEHGQLLGTPEYMSPEQAGMTYQEVDTRSDIYSLGVVLYELLAGTTPFDAKKLREGGLDHIQQVIRDEEPRTPSARLTSLGDKAKTVAERRRTQIITLTRRLHRELEWIPMKAIRKDKTRRYRSASELADDIQNYLNERPLIAGPESSIYRTKKFVYKHAGSVAAAALIAVVIILGLAVSIIMGCRAERARKQEVASKILAQKQQQVAEKQADEYRRLLYVHRIALADNSYHRGYIQRARELLNSCPEDLRDWEWQRLNLISDRSERTLRGHDGWIMSVALSPDGTRIASGSYDKTIKIWDFASGRELRTLRGHEGEVGPVAFSPGGNRVISGSMDKTIRVWDVKTGDELMKLIGHGTEVQSVGFSHDGKRILSDIGGRTIKVWNVANGDERIELKGNKAKILTAVFSPDDKLIVSGSKDGLVKVWNASTGRQIMTLRGHQDDVSSVMFSPNGARIVSGSWDSTVKIWDASNGNELKKLEGHKDRVYEVAFSPDGRRIISASRDKAVKSWDATNGTVLTTLYGHVDQVLSVAFSPVGNQIISGGLDKTIKVWDLDTDRERIRLADKGRVFGFSPEGERIVVSGENAIIKVLDVGTGTELMSLRGHDHDKSSVILGASFSPDGKRIISSAMDKTSKVWDADTGAELMTIRRLKGCVCAIFSPNNQWIASWAPDYWGEGTYENTIKLYDVQTGEELMTFDGHEYEVQSIAFSPDSKRIASCDINEVIKVWNVKTGNEIMTLKHTGGCFSVAYSPDGSLIASGGTDADDKIKLWDAPSGEELMTLKGHTSGIGSLAFSPDGKRLVSGGKNGIVKLWDVTIGFEVMNLQERGANSPWPVVHFSPDGKTIAIGSDGITLLKSSLSFKGYGG